MTETEDARLTIFYGGEAAAFDGKALESTPYPEGDERRDWWTDGFKWGDLVGFDYGKVLNDAQSD
jgi:hypothetical protein